METIIISLGGSLIVPEEVDIDFLKEFREFIINNKNKKFIIICGGGRTARKYQAAAAEITNLTRDDLDWLGIHSTRLNAHLLRTIFRDIAYKTIIKNPNKKIRTNKRVIIAAGWRPGCSTDYDAVLLAENFNVKEIINITNIDYVYDKDPKKFRNAKPIKRIGWKDFRKMVGSKWDPGLNLPFDPVASRGAQKLGLKVIICGKDINNLNNIIKNKKFRGTVIS